MTDTETSILMIDPRLRALFVTAVGRAVDTIEMSQREICEVFAILAIEGFDRDHVELPPSVKVNPAVAQATPHDPYDKLIPVVRPAADNNMP